jgi:hypothetical protein
MQTSAASSHLHSLKVRLKPSEDPGAQYVVDVTLSQGVTCRKHNEEDGILCLSYLFVGARNSVSLVLPSIALSPHPELKKGVVYNSCLVIKTKTTFNVFL